MTAYLTTPRADTPDLADTAAFSNLAKRPPQVPTMPTGLAVIQITGWLSARTSPLEAWGWVTSYERLHAQLHQALSDSEVQHIVLDIDSAGGSATGAFELADALFAARAVKPITALAHFTACSGAYLLASAASRIVVSQTSAVGSIGVRADHVDWSRRNKREGIQVTTVSAGAHKNDLTPHEPISEQSRATLTHQVQSLYQLFVSAVARYRSGLTEQAVRETEAAVYVGQEAMAQGLADELAAPQTVIDQLAAEVGATSGQRLAAPLSRRVRYQARAMQLRATL